MEAVKMGILERKQKDSYEIVIFSDLNNITG